MPHRARRAGAKSSMDEFLDELKKRETLRSFGADVDGPAPPRAAPPAYEGRTEGTGYQGTTNLCVNNLAATVTEEKLMQVFGAFGDIFSVKVMWPRSEDERRRGRNRGFVSFRTREDADEALNALDEEGLLTLLGRRMAEFPLEPPLSDDHVAALPPGEGEQRRSGDCAEC